ncbi:hypothetical protein C1888_27910 [Pseudomonas sp. GW531-T4]|nr:hypothetical protein C1888_27910 [Pseudomonas sp. GW531-T4]
MDEPLHRDPIQLAAGIPAAASAAGGRLATTLAGCRPTYLTVHRQAMHLADPMAGHGRPGLGVVAGLIGRLNHLALQQRAITWR